MNAERRHYVRLILEDKSFAVLGSNTSKVGKIKNISRGGLSFEYIAGESARWHPSRVDIFMIGHGFHMYDVPCEMIYETEIQLSNAHHKYLKNFTTKRCGVKFGELAEDDLAELVLYLKNLEETRICNDAV